MNDAELKAVIGADIKKFRTGMAEVSNTMNKVSGDVSGSVNNIEQSTGRMGGGLKKIVGGIAAAFAVGKIKEFGQSIVQEAAKVKATSAQFNQVFGDMGDAATQSMEKIAKDTGMIPSRLKGTFTQIAAFAKTTGLDTADALDLTSRATRAAADSAAFYDKSIEDVTGTLQSYLKGNYENDAALGISSTETTRNAKANELYGQSFKDLSEAQKQLTLLAMVEDGNKLSGALGQAALESESYENRLGNLKETFTQLKAKMGEPFLDIVVTGMKKVSEVINGIDFEAVKAAFQGFKDYIVVVFTPLAEDVKAVFDKVYEKIKEAFDVDDFQGIIDRIKEALSGLKDNAEMLTPIIVGLTTAMLAFKLMTGVAAIIAGITKALEMYRNGATLATIAQKTLNITLAANPFMIAAVMIGVLVAAGVALYKNWDIVKAKLAELKEKFSVDWQGIKDGVKNKVEGMKTQLATDFNTIKTNIANVGSNIKADAANTWQSIKSDITSKVSQTRTQLATDWQTMRTNAGASWDSMKSGASSSFETLKSTISTKVGEAARNMKTKFAEGVTSLLEDARAMPGKIGTAISNAAGNAVQGVKDLANKVIDTFKSVLGIKSPSKEFAKLGGYVIQGLMNGLSKNNVSDFALKIFKDISGGAADSIDKLKGFFGGQTLSTIKSFMSSVGGSFKDLFSGGLTAISTAHGSGVERWRALATQALMMEGQFTPANLERMLMQMRTESGGNPRAINLWDSNAKKGIPSKGLMQTIDPTFYRYARPGFNSNVYDPLSNMLASIRYSKSRYGSLSNAWHGRGYASGGIFKGSKDGSFINLAENGGDEAVVPLSNKSRMKPFATAISNMMPGSNDKPTVIINNEFNIAEMVVREEADITKIAQALVKMQRKQERAKGVVSYGI